MKALRGSKTGRHWPVPEVPEALCTGTSLGGPRVHKPSKEVPNRGPAPSGQVTMCHELLYGNGARTVVFGFGRLAAFIRTVMAT